jgi:N-acetylmuramoyl-L-alanine amidase
MIGGRSLTAAVTACMILFCFIAPAFPSYNSEAERKYAVAARRLADLQKSNKKMKYRSYWIDCIRTFELVERKYPKSPYAANACFRRASLYSELYQFSKYTRDLDSSMKMFGACQTSYPNHEKAPEALYRIIDLSVEYKRNLTEASKAYAKLAEAYAETPWVLRAKSRLKIEIAPANAVQKPEHKKTPAQRNPSAYAQTSVINSIRYWSGDAYTRIVIDQNKPIRFQTRELKNPDRLVFDLGHARMSGSINKEPIPVNDGILKQVRASQFEPGTVRVVLDLANIKSYVAFPLHDPERLVIDVTGEKNGNPSAADQQSEPGSGAGGDQKVESKTDNSVIIPPVKMPVNGNNDGQNLSLSRQMGLKVRTIAIDAGHGGHDPGAIGRNGLQEKKITLDIAKRLAILIKDRLGCDIVMTRDKDVFIPLEERPAVARMKGADLFVSIHVNASPRRKTRGIETYVQSLTASDREAMATAARENAMSTKKLSELKTELDRIFADLTRDDKIEESLHLADAVHGSLVSSLKPVNSHAADLKSNVKRAFFYVLINTEMPSILAEVGFISNTDEEKLLRKEAYRQNIAEALFEGVKKYVDARIPQMMGI